MTKAAEMGGTRDGQTSARAMTEHEYTAWLAEAITAYAADKVGSGQWTPSESLARSAREYAELLPAGTATPGQFLYTLRDGTDTVVGMLWFAASTKFDAPVAYVYDIAVHPAHQRRGHGRRALQWLEGEAAARGLRGIALHVFGHNAPARALYAALGYEPTNLNLYKPVGAAAAVPGPAAPSPGPAGAARPRVGVAVLVMRDGQVLLGQRIGSHGAGTWALPGGHLEFGESIEACAAREVLEETGLQVHDIRHAAYTNDLFEAEGLHYVTLFVQARCDVGEPQVLEPGKCRGWAWYAWGALPQPLFAPLASMQGGGFRPMQY